MRLLARERDERFSTAQAVCDAFAPTAPAPGVPRVEPMKPAPVPQPQPEAQGPIPAVVPDPLASWSGTAENNSRQGRSVSRILLLSLLTINPRNAS